MTASASTSASSKEKNIEFLRKQINKSYQEKKLVTTGFAINSKEDASKEKDEKTRQIIVVKRAANYDVKDESLSKQTPPTKSTSVSIGLVSNDYNSDDSN